MIQIGMLIFKRYFTLTWETGIKEDEDEQEQVEESPEKKRVRLGFQTEVEEGL